MIFLSFFTGHVITHHRPDVACRRDVPIALLFQSLLRGVLWQRPYRRQELATQPSVEPTPSHPFPYVDLETRDFAVFLCVLMCILVKMDSR